MRVFTRADVLSGAALIGSVSAAETPTGRNSMKIKHAAGLIAAMALMSATSSLKAQPTNLTLYNFDTDQVSATPYNSAWGNWFGSVFAGVSWDAGNDSSNNANSGSLELMLNFPGGNQYVLWDGGSPNYAPLDLGTWTNLSFDIRYDATSVIRTNTSAARAERVAGGRLAGFRLYAHGIEKPELQPGLDLLFCHPRHERRRHSEHELDTYQCGFADGGANLQ